MIFPGASDTVFSPLLSPTTVTSLARLSGVLLPWSRSGQSQLCSQWGGATRGVFTPWPQCYTSHGHQPPALSQTLADDNNVTDHQSVSGSSGLLLAGRCLVTVYKLWSLRTIGRGMILMMWGMVTGHGASVMRMLTIRVPVTKTLSVMSGQQLTAMVRQTSWHWLHCSVSAVRTIGQKTVSNALANCHCSCQWPQKSNVYISVPGSKLQSKLDNSEDR